MKMLLKITSVLTICSLSENHLYENFSWTRITFKLPRHAKGNLTQDYVNNVPMGARVWRNTLFITLPRRVYGLGFSSLNYIPLNSRQTHNVPLIPYPSWEENQLPATGLAKHSIVSVYRVSVDTCDRLWFIDTGAVEPHDGNSKQIQPSAIVVMNLVTRKIIRRYEFPKDVAIDGMILAALTIDITNGNCNDAYAYIPDMDNYRLIVYSYKENKAWVFKHNYFKMEPLAGDFSLSNHQFSWADGIFSIELSDVKKDGFKEAYFHAFCAFHEYKVSTRILRNESMSTRTEHEFDFQLVGYKGSKSQSTMADLHIPTGVIFYGLPSLSAVGCWNTKTDITLDFSIVGQNDKLVYSADLDVYRGKVYVLISDMPGYVFGKLNYEKVNFGIWSNTVMDAIRGTKCEV